MTKIKVVLSGSGTRYPVHVGGLIRLVEEGYEVEEICGTSGGAIVAAGIASGYKIGPEMINLIKELLPSKNNLIDYSFWALLFKWGFIKGDRITELFRKYAPNKFSETIIPLHVVTTNLERRSARIFSTQSTPNMCVATAVRASMSIPGVFTPVEINGELYVDGGLTGNYMLDIFGTGENVFGLRFGTVNKLSEYDKATVTPIRGVGDYIDANIDAMINATMREHVEDAMYARTITLKTKHGGLNFKMTESDVDSMVREGYDSVDRWLKKKGVTK